MAKLDPSQNNSSVGWMVLGCYTVMLHFQAATASVTGSYQAGIEAIQLIFSPAWVLAAVMIPSVLNRNEFAEGYRQLSALAFLISVGMLPVLKVLDLIGGNYYESTNDLAVTITHSMFAPSISNRSYIAVIKYSIIAACHAGGATLLASFRTQARY